MEAVDSNRTRLFEHTLPGVGAPRARQHRTGVRARARCWTRGQRKQPIWGKTEEVAPSGLIICADQAPPLGALIRVCLFTAHGELVLTAEVVHQLNGIGFGCRFVDLNERQEVAIRLLRTTQPRSMAA